MSGTVFCMLAEDHALLFECCFMNAAVVVHFTHKNAMFGLIA